MHTLQLFSSSSYFTNFQLTVQKSRSRKSRIESRNNASQLQESSSLRENVFSDSVSAVHALSSCTRLRDLKLGSCIHAAILKSALHANVFVNNSLLDMYTKCGCVDNAAKLFEHMSERTVVSWTSMISGYYQSGSPEEGISIFSRMLETVNPNEFTIAVLLQACTQKDEPKLIQVIHSYVVKNGFVSDNFLQNSLINAYAKSGMLVDAEKFLVRFSCRDVVSWTSVISGCVFSGMVEEALLFFSRMQEDGVIPNEVTILAILHACSLIKEWQILQWVHALVTKAGWCNNVLIVNSLVEMYLVNGYFQEGMRTFCEFCLSGDGLHLCPETVATMLQRCGHSGYLKLGEQIHGYLIKNRVFPCMVIENSLIDMYAENERSDSAIQLFARMIQRDIVSWNTMITCLVKNGEPCEALRLLGEIHRKNEGDMISPDFITMLVSIQSCSNLASLQLGQVIHGYIIRTGMVCDILIQNAFMDMYGRSGRLDLAEKVFQEMPIKDLSSWNSQIAAYGINGDGTSALQVFTELKKSDIHQPNAITFVNILSACAHAGMVKEGFEIFNCIEREYQIQPSMEHFACMVDLLGRSGRLEEAEAFIENMPSKPSQAVWGALLGACGLFGNVDIADRAAKKLSILEPEGKVWRVALANVYASVGRWEDAAKVRAEMRGLDETRKEWGWSSVEVGGDMFKFMVNDTRNPDSKMIYEVLRGMNEHIRDGAGHERELSDKEPEVKCLPSSRYNHKMGGTIIQFAECWRVKSGIALC